MDLTTVTSNLKRVLEMAPELGEAAISIYLDKEYDEIMAPRWSAYILVTHNKFYDLCSLLDLVIDDKPRPSYADMSAHVVAGVHLFPPPKRKPEASDEQV